MFGLYRKEGQQKEVLLSEASEDELKAALRRINKKKWKSQRKEIYTRLNTIDKNINETKRFKIILTNAEVEIHVNRNEYIQKYDQLKEEGLRYYITNTHEILTEIVKTHPFVRDFIFDKKEMKEKLSKEIQKIAEDLKMNEQNVYGDYQLMKENEDYRFFEDE